MRELIRRLTYLLRHRRRDADLTDELAFHREMKQQEFERQGMTREQAAAAGRRALGNELASRQYARDVWISPSLQEIAMDFRFALRLLVRDRSFAITAILVLGLGIGVNNMMFTMIYGHTLRQLPMEHPERVLYISTFDERTPDRALSYPDFEDLQRARTFSGMAAFSNVPVGVGDKEHAPERFEGTYLTANGFDLIGRAAVLGRLFLPEEDRTGASPVVMLGERAWRSQYRADPAILGRSILINGEPAVVVGVVPDRSGFPSMAEVWLPLSRMPGLSMQKRDARGLRVFGRVRDGVTLTDARLEVEAIVERVAREFPDTSKSLRPRVVPISERFLGRATDPAWLAFISAGFLVLAVSCANVANLMLTRSALRAREIAIRGSLGASRRRIVGQLLIESAVLAAIGSVVGFAGSLMGVRLWRSTIPDNLLPYWVNYELDARVLGALVAVAFGAVLVFGLVPAIQASKIDVNRVLKDGGRTGTARGGARRLTTAFLVAEFALSVVLMANGVVGLRNTGPRVPSEDAINTTELVTASMTLPAQKYPRREEKADFYRRLQAKVAAMLGVSNTAIASTVPSFRGTPQQQLELEGRAQRTGEPALTAATVWIGPRYFETLAVPLERGRGFEDRPSENQQAIVSRRFVDLFFPDQDPIGRRIRLTGPSGPATEATWTTILGVAQDIRYSPDRTPEPVVYLPLLGTPPATAALIVRSSTETSLITTLLRNAAATVDPDLPLYRVLTMKRAIHEAEWNGRLSRRMIISITLIALGLSVVSLYAVTAHGVVQRTHEIGIRMALGAEGRQVRRLILSRALAQVSIGLVFGLVCTLAWDATFYSGRNDLRFVNPSTLLPVCAVLALVTLAACVVPVRRATRLDPMRALRHE